MPSRFREPRIPEARFPRSPSLGSSVNFDVNCKTCDMPSNNEETMKRYLETLKQVATVDTATAVLVIGVQGVANFEPLWLVPSVGGAVASLLVSMVGLFISAKQRVEEHRGTTLVPFWVFDVLLGLSIGFFCTGLLFSFLLLAVVSNRT